jgi:hypothetical protein
LCILYSITRLSKVCKSSTIVARDAVRIPSSVNDLGEYMTAASDNLREAAGNAVTAYTFSNLEQYIPLCLIQTVRVLAAGEGIVARAPLSMNGIESLDRSGSVLYRDLKGATRCVCVCVCVELKCVYWIVLTWTARFFILTLYPSLFSACTI